jgi:hypothetical protein
MNKYNLLYAFSFFFLAVLSACSDKEDGPDNQGSEQIELSTSSVLNISASSAVGGGNITRDGGSPITARGLCWSVNPDPTLSNSFMVAGSGTGEFRDTMRNLSPNTKYYVRAYATNANTTAYGQSVSFTTAPAGTGVIQLSTDSVTGVTINAAVCGGNISNDGGSPVTERGICWNTTGSPTRNGSFLSLGSGNGSFSGTISGLNSSIIYFVRAYAINANDTAYGNEVSFITAVPFSSVLLDFSNVVGALPLSLGSATNYTNSSGEQFTVGKLKYYISNVQLMKGTVPAYTMPESYFLVDQASSASRTCTITNVPADTYTGVRFLIGVDSTRNVSGAQVGALDPVNGMFWTWNSGYIFFKMEGSSPAAPAGITYHIGGFRNANNTNALRTVDIPFGSGSLVVDGHRPAEIFVKADVLKVFSGPPNVISIANINFQMAPGGNALLIADNYAQMFSFLTINN